MAELSQIADFREEARQLHGLLATLPDAEWAKPTLF